MFQTLSLGHSFISSHPLRQTPRNKMHNRFQYEVSIANLLFYPLINMTSPDCRFCVNSYINSTHTLNITKLLCPILPPLSRKRRKTPLHTSVWCSCFYTYFIIFRALPHYIVQLHYFSRIY